MAASPYAHVVTGHDISRPFTMKTPPRAPPGTPATPPRQPAAPCGASMQQVNSATSVLGLVTPLGVKLMNKIIYTRGVGVGVGVDVGRTESEAPLHCK